MNINLGRIAFGRGAYLLFLVSVIIALAFADLPLPVFLAFVSAILAVSLVAEALSKLASLKLEPKPISAPVAPFGQFEYGTSAPVAALLLAFGQTQKEPEFSQTQVWFTKTSVGTFA